MVDTVRLGGIKLSGELVQVDFQETLAPDAVLIGLLDEIVSAKLNIPHLHQGYVHGGMQTSLCLPAEDYTRFQSVTGRDVSKFGGGILPSVGTISLFPHGRDISFAAKVMHTLVQKSIPVYGISSSVSALVLHTDFSILDEAVEQILTFCHLPENHSPFRPVIVLGDEIIETVAVYWEPRIRIYGMDLRKGLTDLSLSTLLSNCRNESWSNSSVLQTKFHMFSLLTHPSEHVSLNFLVGTDWEKAYLPELTSLADETDSTFSYTEGVEMVSFHGPHFQDRYGIASMAFSQLYVNGFKLLRSGFTGTSVHLVFEEGKGEAAMKCLAEKFVVPSSGGK